MSVSHAIKMAFGIMIGFNMREGQIIRLTKQPNTITTLYHGLLRLGVGSGDTVLVHSSLSGLGWVCGGAPAVITALLNALGNTGTLVMPAHSGDWSDPAGWENPPVPEDWIPTIRENMPAFNPSIAPTRGMGRIAELFRTFPGTLRSNHPQVSFCANGKFAEQITAHHPLTPQLGSDSPLGKIYDRGGKVLLLVWAMDLAPVFIFPNPSFPECLKSKWVLPYWKMGNGYGSGLTILHITPRTLS